MYILGLTGSIGMGKTEAAKAFRELGVPVFDSDAEVHALFDVGGAAVAVVAEAFPEALIEDRIDRSVLGEIVFSEPRLLSELEEMVHPLVRQAQFVFLEESGRIGAPLVVLDIPLLLESGADKNCDAVAVVSAPESVQRERVLARPGMTEERYEAILSQQMPDEEKRHLATYIIPTDQGLAVSADVIKEIVDEILERIHER